MKVSVFLSRRILQFFFNRVRGVRIRKVVASPDKYRHHLLTSTVITCHALRTTAIDTCEYNVGLYPARADRVPQICATQHVTASAERNHEAGDQSQARRAVRKR